MKTIRFAPRYTSIQADAHEQESCFSSPVCALVAAFFFCVVLVTIFPCSPLASGYAYAATWPVPTSGLSASVLFHETYSAGDKNYVHSGIDIPASAGMQISSPQAGTVRYTGAVPSGDSRVGQGSSSQKTMNAVSVELQDGRVITLMPFSDISVSRGDYVEEGESLGTLAPGGDPSSPQTHVHMGLKDGRIYYDPMSLFGAASHDLSQDGSSAGDFAVIDAAREFVSPQVVQDSTLELSAQEFMSDVSAVQEAELETVPQESFGMIESGAYDWSPVAGKTPGFESAIWTVVEPVYLACRAQASDLICALSSVSHCVGVPLPVLLGICGVATALFVFALVVVVFRFISSHVGEMWRKRIPPLFMRGGGDSMHKLFPASGTAFISRSRMSPREVTK